jgi:hypothetical protein
VAVDGRSGLLRPLTLPASASRGAKASCTIYTHYADAPRGFFILAGVCSQTEPA